MHHIRVLEIALFDRDDFQVCKPEGELDSYTVASFREALSDLDFTSKILIDMSGVSFLDSTGLGALIGMVHRTREGGGRLAVCSAKPNVSKLLKMTGFDRLVTMTADLDSAVEFLSRDDLLTEDMEVVRA